FDWSNETFYVVLGFFAIREVFHLVFRNFYGIFWFRFIFPIVGILMLALAAVRSMLLPAPHLQKLMAAIVSLEIAVNFLEVGMLVLFFLLVSLFHMRWRQYAFGIVLGFGIIACSDLALYLLHSEFGTKFNFIAEITPSIAYI